MSKSSGLLNLSANFEVLYGAPLDSRAIVPTKADLLLANTWNGFAYVGMLTVVTEDATPANNGVYRLVAADFTQETSWALVGASEGGTPAHNDTTSIQGGTPGEYNHLTNAELAVVQATSGSNTGDQDLSGLLPTSHLTDFTHADIAHTNRAALDNVSGTNTGDETALTMSTLFGALSDKATDAADADRFVLLDSEDTEALKTKTFADLKTQILDAATVLGIFTPVTVTAADSPYTATEVNNTVYSVDLTDGSVVFNLPAVTPGIERNECYVYIERNPNGNSLTVNASGTDLIRGQTTQVLLILRDSMHLVAHNYGLPHWDIFDWSRTDEIVYNPGNAGTTTLSSLQNLLNYLLSTGEISGGEVTAVGDGTITVASAEWLLRDADNPIADCRAYAIAASGVLTPTDNATSYLVINYNSGTPSWSIETNIATVPCTDRCVKAILHRRGTQVDYFKLGAYSQNFAASYARAQAVQNWLAYGDGLEVTEVGNRGFSVTAGALYQGVIRLTTAAFNTQAGDTFEYWYRDGVGGWTVIPAQTVADNINYDDGSGTLAAAPNNRYMNAWVYVLIDNPSRLCVVYGQQQFTSLAAAQATKIPTTMPPFAQKYSIGKLVAKLIIQQNQTNLVDVQSPFSTVFTSATPVNHNNLSGLQGGQVGMYYHLTEQAYDAVNRGATQTLTGLLTAADQDIGGIKTFNQNPRLPNNPVTDNESTRKAYVDAKAKSEAILYALVLGG